MRTAYSSSDASGEDFLKTEGGLTRLGITDPSLCSKLVNQDLMGMRAFCKTKMEEVVVN